MRATAINDEMKIAAVKSLAELAKEDVPDSVIKAYGDQPIKFGKEFAKYRASVFVKKVGLLMISVKCANGYCVGQRTSLHKHKPGNTGG